MELNEIIALKEINLEKESLNEKGSITSKPSIWYLIGRTILWVITCGHAKINPKLHAGLNKVIVSTENILKKPEQLQENAAKDLSAALEKLKTIKKISLSQQNDLVHLIQEIKNQTLAKGETKSNNLDPVQKPGPQIDITIKSATSVDETPKTQNSQAVYELPKDRTEFIRQVANGTIPDRKTFLQQIVTFYPEIELYKGATNSTPELANEAGVERKRTEMSLLFVYWVWQHNPNLKKEDDAAYQDFIRGQQPGKELTWESFKELCAIYRAKYNTIEKLDYFLTTMAVHDLGKVDFIQDIAKQDGVKGEHDEILLHIFNQHPTLLASFQRLPKAQQEELITQWAWDYLGPQFIQGESVPASLAKILKAMKEQPELADHFMFHDLCDLAGAMGFGQPNKEGNFVNGCRTLDENTFKAWKETHKQMIEAETPQQAYSRYLAFRAEFFDLGLEENDPNRLHFDITKPEDYAIVRVCCMLRLFENDKAQLVKKAFNFMPSGNNNNSAYNAFIEELNVSGLDGKKAILVYYAPVLMQNIWNYSFNAPDLVDMKPEEIKVRSFAEGLKILYQIYKTTREHLTNKGQDNEDGVFTVNVSAISKSFNKPKEQKDALNLKTLEEALSSDALSKKNPIVFDAENSSAAIKL